MSESTYFTEKFFALPKYSFLLVNGGVRRVEDTTGGWVDRNAAHELIEIMQEEINRLNSALEDIATLKNLTARKERFICILQEIAKDAISGATDE